jgi:hypothetical protein
MDLHLNNRTCKRRSTVGLRKPDAARRNWPRTPLPDNFEELSQTREMPDSRYDDLKSGRVKPISRDELIAHFREKSTAALRTSRIHDHV